MSAILVGVVLLALSVPAMAADGKTKTIVIKKGDTLWDLAVKYLDHGLLWKEIHRLNPYIKNPDLIYPGDELVLPAEVAAEVSEQLKVTQGRTEEDIRIKSDALDNLQMKYNQAVKDRDKLKQQVADLEKKLGSASKDDSSVSDLKKQLADKEAEIKAMSAKVDPLKNEIAALKAENQQMKDLIEELEKQLNKKDLPFVLLLTLVGLGLLAAL
jgi:LysM repeat protein